MGVVDGLEVVDVEHDQRDLEGVALAPLRLTPQRGHEVLVVEEAGQPVRHRRARRALVDRDLDDLRVLEVAAHVHEVVEQGDPQADVAVQVLAQGLAVAADAAPVALGLRLREAQVGEDVEDGGVDGLPVPALALEASEQLFFVRRIGLQELKQGVPDPVVVDARHLRPVSRVAGGRTAYDRPRPLSSPPKRMTLVLLSSPSWPPLPAPPAPDVYFEQTTVVLAEGRPAGPGVVSRVWYAGRRMRLEPAGRARRSGPHPAPRPGQGLSDRSRPRGGRS